MKKIIVVLLLLANMKSYGQLIINGDFNINAGDNALFNCANFNTGTVPTFSDGSIPNWWRTHGSPQIANSPTYNPNDMFLHSASGFGEGIVGGYNFKQGKTYIIDVNVASSNYPSSLNLEARKGIRPKNDDCGTVECYPEGQSSQQQGMVPIPSPITSYQNIISSPLHGGENIFLYTPNSDYTWIMMYSKFNDHCEVAKTYIDHIYVNAQCKEEKYIPEFDNTINPASLIEPYYTSNYKRIFVGSQYGSSALADNHSRNGELIAIESILFSANTLITPTAPTYNTPGKFFTAIVDPFNCNYKPPHEGGGGVAGREAPTDNKVTRLAADPNGVLAKNKFAYTSIDLNGKTTDITDINLTDDRFRVYPNPSSGTFTIQLPSANNYSIAVTDYIGTTVYKQTVTGEHSYTLTLDSKLPSGTYILRMEGKNFKRIEKLNILR